MKEFFRFRDVVSFLSTFSHGADNSTSWKTGRTRKGKLSSTALSPRVRRLHIETLEERALLSVTDLAAGLPEPTGAEVWGVNTADEVAYNTLVATKTTLETPVPVLDSKTDTTVTFSWAAISNALNYAVEYKLSADSDWTTKETAYTGTSYTVSGLEKATSYDFRVKSNADSAGEDADSDFSEALTVKTMLDTPSTVVTNVNDVVDEQDGVVSLREALVYAGTNGLGTTITFAIAAGSVITLDGMSLVVNKSLTIDASALYDDANDAPGITISGNNASRVFTINAGTVSMIGLTIADGLLTAPANATYYGAGIYNAGATLTLTDCTITNNHNSGGVLGGGISNNTGTLTLNNCIVSGNSASSGGGIYNNVGTLTMTNCTVTGNTSNTIGGGISNVSGGRMMLLDCAVTENLGNTNGGGIYNYAAATMSNCIVTENSASKGGGIYNCTTSTLMSATNCTIVGNTAADGGGLYNYGRINVNNSIIVENSATASGTDVYKSINYLYAYNTLSSFTNWTNAATEGVTNYEYDSTLPLFTDAANDDYTLARNSQVFNKGRNSSISLTTDLAGNPRIRNGIVDLGAYEFQFALDAPVLAFDSKTDTEISISWGAVDNVTSYAVEYKQSSASNWIPAETVSAETVSYTVSELSQTTSYDIRVRAVGDAVYQDSEWSATLTETTKTKLPTPAITYFENQDAGQDTSGTIPSLTVNWETSAGAAGYKVEYQLDGAAVWQSAIAAGSDSSYSLHNPEIGVKYNFRITALSTYEATVSADYVDSSPSEIKSVIKLAAPSVPTFTNTTNSITLKWVNITGLNYDVQYINRADGNLIWTTADPLVDGNTGEYYYEFDQLDEGTEFDVQIQAYNSDQDTIVIKSDWTESLTVNSLKKLEIGDVTVTSRTDEEFTLTWDAITGAARCSIEVVYYDEGYQSIPADQISGPTKQADGSWSVTVSGLNAGTTYLYSIVASPEAGSKIYFSSDVKTGTVKTKTPLAAPGNFTVIYYDENNVTVTWDKVNNAANYQVSYTPDVEGVAQPISVEQPGNITTVSWNFKINSGDVTTFSVYAAPLSLSEYVNSETAAYSVYKLTTPTVELYDKTSTSFTLRWKPVTNADSYSLKVKGINDPLAPTSYDGEYYYLDVTGLGTGTSCEWTLTVNPIADTDTLDYVKALYGSSTTTKMGVLDAPSGLAAANVTSTATQVKITWNEVDNNEGYQYRWKDASSNTWSDWTYASDEEVAIPAANGETDIMPGTAYNFEVKAPVTEYYDESLTTSITFQLLETPVAAVSEITASSFKLTWDTIENAKTTSDGYTVSVVPVSGSGDPLISPPVYAEGIGWSVDVTGLAAATAYTWSVTSNPIAAVSEMFYVSSNAVIGTVTTKLPIDTPVLAFVGKTDTEAAFSWNVDTNASSYTVEYKLASETEWKPAESTWSYSTAGARTTCTAAGLNQTTDYEFRVRANGDDVYETTSWSMTLSVTTKTKLAVPVLAEVGKTDAQITFEWTAVADASSYAVEYKLASAGVWTTLNASWGETSYTVSELSQTTDYEFRVKANGDADYQTSEYSETLSVATKTKLAAPVLAEVSKTNTQISFEWAAIADSTSYTVEYKLASAGVWTTLNASWSDTAYTVSGLSETTDYEFRVMANANTVSEFVGSEYSETLSVTTKTKLAAPVLAEVGKTDAQITFSWTAIANASSYAVEYKLSSAAEWTKAEETWNDVAYTVTGLSAATAYDFRVTANGDTDYQTSEYSEMLSVTTDNTIELSADFIKSVADNQTGMTLGTLGVSAFGTDVKDAAFTFYLDNADRSSNFTATWNTEANLFDVIYDNTNITAGDYSFKITAAVGSGASLKTASTQLSFTVTATTDVNGLIVSGTEGVDWTFNAETDYLEIIGGNPVTITGTAREPVYLVIHEGKTVDDNLICFKGVSFSGGTVEISVGQAWTEGELISGGVFDGTYYTLAPGASCKREGITFTNTEASGNAVFYTIALPGIDDYLVVMDAGTLIDAGGNSFALADTLTDGLRAKRIVAAVDPTTSNVGTVNTFYEVDGFYFAGESTGIVAFASYDSATRTITLDAGDWATNIVSENALDGLTVVLTQDATLAGTGDSSNVYSRPADAMETVCVLSKVGEAPNSFAKIISATDFYSVGGVILSIEHGKYTLPTVAGDMIAVTDETWTVSGVQEGATGGTIVLAGTDASFTDVNGTVVKYNGLTLPLVFDGTGALNFESLSVVNTATDVVDAYDGVTSLREAIQFAGASPLWGNTITFSDTVDWTDAANTITLSDIYGSLMIDRALTIDAGTKGITIDGNGVGSVFAVTKDAGTDETPVTLIGLTITGGTGNDYNAPIMGETAKAGGAINNNGVLFVMDCTLTGNTADYGGAIANAKIFVMADSTIVGNTAAEYGGAIYNFAGNLALSNVTIAENTATNGGGGIYQNDGALLLVNSIVVGNKLSVSAPQEGADLAIAKETANHYANYSMIGSAYNFASSKSGLAAFNGGASGVYGTTVDNAYADVFGRNVFDGMTIQIDSDSPAAVSGTLVGAIGPTIYYYNRNDGYWWNAVGNAKSSFQFNVSDAVVYGLTGGQIDTTAQNLDVSGNRITRVETLVRFSIGAFSSIDAPSTVVTTLEDIVCANDGLISIREAIAYADTAAACGNVITFDANIVYTGTPTITLQNGALKIDKSLTIDGSNLPSLTIDAGGCSRVFYIVNESADVLLTQLTLTGGATSGTDGANVLNAGLGGNIYADANLTLDAVVVENGSANDGGGVYSLGNLAVINSTIYHNFAVNDGGGVIIAGGTLNVIDSRFAANDAKGSGGALFVSADGAASAANTIFAGNRAAEDGGAVALNGTLSLYNATLAGNQAQDSGGGIVILEGTAGGSLTVYNSIIAQNIAGEGNADFSDGSNGAAINAASSISSYDFGASAENLVYTADDPLFMYALPAGDWETAAPEWLVWLPCLTANSIALDSGNNNYVDSATTTDYLNNSRIVNNIVDRGAIEWQIHSFYYVVEPTTLLEAADAKAGTVIASFESKEFVGVKYSVTVNGEATDVFTIDAANSQLLLAADVPMGIIYQSIVITAAEADGSYSLTLDPFTLIIADKVIDLRSSGVYTIDCDGNSAESIVTVTNENGQVLYDGNRNNGLFVLNSSQKSPDTFIVTAGALVNMNTIIINCDSDPSISCRDTLFLESSGNNNSFLVEGSPNGYGGGSIELNSGSAGGANITFGGLKNVFIDGSGKNGVCGDGNQFAVHSLDANLNILNMTGVELDFASPDGNSSGVVFNMDSPYHQSVLVGQQGTFRIEDSATVTRVTLPNGRNVVSGNSGEGAVTVIDGGGSQSHNVIMLLEGENTVDIAGQSTITAEAATVKNEIIVADGTGTTVNLSKTAGENIVSIDGDKSIYYGGGGSTDTVTVNGDNCILTLTETKWTQVVLNGDNGVIQTGAGADVIEYSGSNGSVSAGDGDDTIRILADSTGNFISGGAGNDFIYAALCGGANMFYANSGNDFIVGGSGNDAIFGNEGRNFLAGNSGSDKVVGGTGRDVLAGSLTSNLASLDESALKAVFDDLLTAWDESDEAVVDLLGEESASDGEADTLQRIIDGGVEIFFANALDSDIENASAADKVYRN